METVVKTFTKKDYVACLCKQEHKWFMKCQNTKYDVIISLK